MYKHNSKLSGRKKLFIAGVILLVLVIILSVKIFVFPSSTRAPDAEVAQSASSTEPSPTSLSGKYLFSGTIVLARAVERYAVDASGQRDYSQPFSELDSFNPKQYDGWLVDWECPTTNTLTISYQEQINNLVFNCRPEWLPEFKKYFNFVNLANNHSGDLGEEIFQETQNHMTKAKVQIVGNYDPGVTEDVCEVMALPVKLKMPDGSKQSGKLPVTFCAWHYFMRDPRAGEIELAKQYSDVMPVFGLMHVGAEYIATAGAEQRSIARQIIDNGAEFVIGNSPHWVQDTEVYRGKLIAYSTGNFMFDQLEAETNRGVSIAVEISLDYDENIAGWLALGEECQKQQDNCLNLAKERGLQKPNLKLSYDAVANTTGVRQVTKKASPSIQKAVEERMNWSQTLKQLGQ